LLSPRSRSRLDSIVLSGRRATKIDIAMVGFGNLTRPVPPSVCTYIPYVLTEVLPLCWSLWTCGAALEWPDDDAHDTILGSSTSRPS
jgi:hypothetical protein